MRPMGDWSINSTSSSSSHPLNDCDAADRLAQVCLGRMAAAKPSLELPVQDVMHQGTLAGAGDSGHRGESADRNIDVNALQVVKGGASDAKPGGRADVARWESRSAFGLTNTAR